jgi:hypothetical protein
MRTHTLTCLQLAAIFGWHAPVHHASHAKDHGITPRALKQGTTELFLAHLLLLLLPTGCVYGTGT